MTKYLIDFTYTTPMWGDVELDAADKEDAKTQAIKHVGIMYPEANDIEVTNIEEIVNG